MKTLLACLGALALGWILAGIGYIVAMGRLFKGIPLDTNGHLYDDLIEKHQRWRKPADSHDNWEN